MFIRDFEPIFNNLTTEFVNLKSKIDVLIRKYEDIEKGVKKQRLIYVEGFRAL